MVKNIVKKKLHEEKQVFHHIYNSFQMTSLNDWKNLKLFQSHVPQTSGIQKMI